MDSIVMKSNVIQIIAVKKETKARMFSDLERGSLIRLSIPAKTAGQNRGTYASYIKVENIMTNDFTHVSFNDIEKRHNIRPYYAPADPAMWGKQNVGDSLADIFESAGLVMHKANNDRILGTQQLHMRLSTVDRDKQRLLFTKDCPITFETLQSIPKDRKNIETYDTSGFDHPVDALRYAIIERIIGNNFDDEPETYGNRATTEQYF